MRAERAAVFPLVGAGDAPKTGRTQAAEVRTAIAAKACREADTGIPFCLDNRGSLPPQRGTRQAGGLARSALPWTHAGRYLCLATQGSCGKRWMDVLGTLFERHFSAPAEEVKPLQGQLGGSGRVIVRLRAGQRSAIGILYGVREENVAFLEFSRHFRRHGLPVPEIYGENLSHGAYLEEDLGDTTLFEF